jgi:hypothetical protein
VFAGADGPTAIAARTATGQDFIAQVLDLLESIPRVHNDRDPHGKSRVRRHSLARPTPTAAVTGCRRMP